jgi:hypothetical protein
MKNRDIIIIIILTIILVIVITASIQKKQEIEDIYLSNSKDSTFEELQSGKSYNFKNNDSDIYLIMKVKNLKEDDEIKVKWSRIEKDHNKNDNYITIQQNTINPGQNGSGKIVVMMLKRDNTYAEGKYCVEAYLNADHKITKTFSIDS